MTEHEQFYNELLEAMKKEPSLEGAIFTESESPRNNGNWKCVEIHAPGCLVASMIYPDHMYELKWPGESIKSAAERFAAKVGKEIKRENEIITKQFHDIVRLKKQYPLCTGVVSYEANKEWLRDIPHERFVDLAVYAKMDLGNNTYLGLLPSVISELHMTKEEILKEAKRNTAKSMVFKSLEEMIFDEMVERGENPELTSALMPPKGHSHIFILTNKKNYDGAAVIACPEVLGAVHDLLGKDFYILPSSIHEVQIVSKDFPMPLEDLQKAVRITNQEDIPAVARLSDNVYEFDGKNLKIAEHEKLERDVSPELSTLIGKSRDFGKRR